MDVGVKEVKKLYDEVGEEEIFSKKKLFLSLRIAGINTVF